jgi:hypothetical protein
MQSRKFKDAVHPVRVTATDFGDILSAKRDPCRECLGDALLPWKKHMFNLYATSALSLLWLTFRVIKHLQENDGPLLRSEVYLYIFDAVSTCLVMLLSMCIGPAESTKHMKR